MKFYSTPKDEQETIINIDPFNKMVTLYSTKEHTYKKLKKYLGEPNHFEYMNGLPCSFEYKLSFDDDNLKKIFSITTLIGVHNRRKKIV